MPLRRAALPAAIALLTACTEYSVTVFFEAPPLYPVEDLVVSVYNLGDELADPCEELATGALTLDELRASLQQTVVSAGGEAATLGGIHRVGRKLFHAVGRDAAGVEVAVGCAEHGEVEGADTVSIDGHPIVLTAEPERGTSLTALPVLVTDGRGDPVAEPVTVYGIPLEPGGVGDWLEATTEGGTAVLEMPAPTKPGPAALDVRARWQVGPGVRTLDFNVGPQRYCGNLPTPASASDALESPEPLYQIGRVGPTGQLGIAAFTPINTETQRRRAVVVYHDPDACAGGFCQVISEQTRAPLDDADGPPRALGLIRSMDGTRDRIISSMPGSWLMLDVATKAWSYADGAPDEAAIGLFALDRPGDPCTETDRGGALGLAEFAVREPLAFGLDDVAGLGVDDGAAQFNAMLAARDELPRIRASGCVSDGSSRSPLLRTLVLVDDEAPVIAVSIAAVTGSAGALTLTRGPWSTLPSGFDFGPAGASALPTLIGSDLSLAGPAITRSSVEVVVPGTAGSDGELAIEELERVAIPSIAIATAAGDGDGDGFIDVAGVIAIGAEETSNSRVVVGYGYTPEDRDRLVGVSGATLINDRAALWLIDFDEDGLDELVIGGPRRLRIFDDTMDGENAPCSQ